MTLQLQLTHHFAQQAEHKRLKVALELPLSAGNIGIFGHSGAGKSSLLKSMAGLLQHPSNQLIYLGKHIPLNQPHLSPFVYQFQQGYLFPHLTVQQNLSLVEQHGQFAKHCEFTMAEVTDWCELTPLLTKPVGHLSGGECQRVALARSLLSGKKILLLDEPFSALDWPTRVKFANLLVWLSQRFQLRVIMVSHAVEELASCCHYIMHLEQGKVIQHGLSTTLIDKLSRASHQAHISIVTGQWLATLAEHGLIKIALDAAQQQCILMHQPAFETDQVQLQLAANKISLAKVQPAPSSMLNCLTGVIRKIEPQPNGALIYLVVAEQQLLAEISLLSLQLLALNVGDTVFAQFKAP